MYSVNAGSDEPDRESQEHVSDERRLRSRRRLLRAPERQALRAGQDELVQTLLPAIRAVVRAATSASQFPDREAGRPGSRSASAAASIWPPRRAPTRDVNFIGCEPFVNGMAKLLAAIEHERLDNIRIWDEDVTDLLPTLPDACLDRVYILYPDPWPKRRQRKRRLVSDEMLETLARVMRPGAELRFASDIDDYIGWVLARALRSADFRWTAARAGRLAQAL